VRRTVLTRWGWWTLDGRVEVYVVYRGHWHQLVHYVDPARVKIHYVCECHVGSERVTL
jgi:hypothetical protein